MIDSIIIQRGIIFVVKRLPSLIYVGIVFVSCGIFGKVIFMSFFKDIVYKIGILENLSQSMKSTVL